MKALQELKLRVSQTKVETTEQMVMPEYRIFQRHKGQLFLVWLWRDFTPETLASFDGPCWHSHVTKRKSGESVHTQDLSDDELESMARFAMSILKDLPGTGGLQTNEQKEWATRGQIGVHAFKYCWTEVVAPPI